MINYFHARRADSAANCPLPYDRTRVPTDGRSGRKWRSINTICRGAKRRPRPNFGDRSARPLDRRDAPLPITLIMTHAGLRSRDNYAGRTTGRPLDGDVRAHGSYVPDFTGADPRISRGSFLRGRPWQPAAAARARQLARLRVAAPFRGSALAHSRPPPALRILTDLLLELLKC